jgi:hypothetical protein
MPRPIRNSRSEIQNSGFKKYAGVCMIPVQLRLRTVVLMKYKKEER